MIIMIIMTILVALQNNMILFEYTRNTAIDSSAMVSYVPAVWRWSRGISVADWWAGEPFNIPFTVTQGNEVYTVAVLDNLVMRTVESLEECIEIESSFFWAIEAQVAYIHFPHTMIPSSTASIRLSKLFGATYGEARVFNGIAYHPILSVLPIVSQSVDHTVYQRMATEEVSIELIDAPMYRAVDGKLEAYHMFDEYEDMFGQFTYIKYGKDSTEYADFITLHKGVITHVKKNATRISLTCADARSMVELKFPTETFGDVYSEDDVADTDTEKVIPFGYGVNNDIPAVCVNRTTTTITVDEDNEPVSLPPSDVDYDLSTWYQGNSVEVTSETSRFSQFLSFRLESAVSVTGYVSTAVSGTGVHRISGYAIQAQVDSAYYAGKGRIQYGDTSAEFYYYLNLDFDNSTYVSNADNSCVRFFLNDETPYAWFSFEVTGAGSLVLLAPDSTLYSAVRYAGVRVYEPDYPQFRFAKEAIELLSVGYESDEELIPVTNLPPQEHVSEGIVQLFDADVHEDGLISSDLRDVYVTANLVDLTNPFDILKDINDRVRNVPYSTSNYDMEVCEEEATILGSVSLYLDEETTFYEIIEQLQDGGVVSFRYEDVENISIYNDNPNRDPVMLIVNEYILNLAGIEIERDLTDYADTVEVSYFLSHFGDETVYKNTDYSSSVLLKYTYAKTREFDSLVITEEDALNKSVVLLEELQEALPTVEVLVPDIDIMRKLRIFSIVNVELDLRERAFEGTWRAQVTGYTIDASNDVVTLTLRKKAYSEAFAKITGYQTQQLVVGDVDEGIVGGDTSLGIVGGSII